MENNKLPASEANMKIVLRQPETIEQFERIMGERNARHYMGTVFIAVANSAELQECSPESILNSALRCASMELSCDPAMKQGQLVPYWNSKKGKKEAQLIIHYKGLVNLALRGGRYRHINVSEIYEGYEVIKDVLTGIHSVSIPDPKKFNPDKLIGLLGYFETKDGFKKTVYWTVKQIAEHAAKFAPKNPLYEPTSKHYRTMQIKTVMRDLLSWTDKSSPVSNALDTALGDDSGLFDDDIVDAKAEEVPEDSRKSVKKEKQPTQSDPGSEKDEIKEVNAMFPPEPTPESAPEPVREESRPEPNGQRPYAPEQFKRAVEKLVVEIERKYTETGLELSASDDERRVVASIIDKIYGGDKGLSRHVVCDWLFPGKGSVKEMTPAQVKALFHVMGVRNEPEHHATFDDAPSGNSIAEFRDAYQYILAQQKK